MNKQSNVKNNETERGRHLAADLFGDAIPHLTSKKAISAYAQTLIAIGVKMLNGVEEEGFKEDFLKGAMADKESLNLKCMD